jgi:hypothetical protein
VITYLTPTARVIVIGPVDTVRAARVFLHRACARRKLLPGRPISVQYALPDAQIGEGSGKDQIDPTPRWHSGEQAPGTE